MEGRSDSQLTLINNKRPPRVDPGGHSFVFLNISINKKPIFFSEVVTYKKLRRLGCHPVLFGDKNFTFTIHEHDPCASFQYLAEAE
jgi:hypothetical protein